MTLGGNNNDTYIIKRGGKRTAELFNDDKLLKSVASTCIGARATPGQAETIARQVLVDVKRWLKDRPEVTSKDIRRIASASLEHYHGDAGYLYKQQEKIL